MMFRGSPHAPILAMRKRKDGVWEVDPDKLVVIIFDEVSYLNMEDVADYFDKHAHRIPDGTRQLKGKKK